ncbi:MAG TPA: DUF4041 domain-containing protein [Terriglobales bacterium]|nr:DUF4041 domain-containing protein [Terriglobales bacterium]
MLLAALIVVGIVAILEVTVYRLWKQRNSCRAELQWCRIELQRYAAIANMEVAVNAAKAELEHVKQTTEKLEEQYKQALATYGHLQHEVSMLEENLEDLSFGLYKPHFTFQSSEEYKQALVSLREKMKKLIREGGASNHPQWTVNGSSSEGAKMVRQTTKVMLRAFNGECEAAAANVSYNNIKKMEERVAKAFETINKLGETMQLSLSREYMGLRQDEIRLINEYENKKYQEREEERHRREEMRDSEKAQREIEHAQQEAEAQEATYQKLLEKARREATEATGAKLTELTNKVSEFSAKLDEARKKKEKAIARAQLTKSGFVYVISNIGAFGEGVFKVGMTRRLEPMERIMELSGASVPFPYDLHAMMFSEDAPDLEYALHSFLEERRLNLVNTRKEFFQGIKLAEIKSFVQERGLTAQFIDQAEAREYRETLAKRDAQQTKDGEEKKKPPKFAESLFAEAQSA